MPDIQYIFQNIIFKAASYMSLYIRINKFGYHFKCNISMFTYLNICKYHIEFIFVII